MKNRHRKRATAAIIYTTTAMLAFAGNSIICRLALRDNAIDPSSFTAIRLGSGAVALLIISFLARRPTELRGHGSWISAALLFVYALGFSYAYISLSAGAGALILFGFVQATMILSGLHAGDRPSIAEWLGWILASIGLIWLLLPGEEAPPLTGSALMAAAGVAWGLYSIRGRAETDALVATTANFTWSIVFVLFLVGMTAANVEISTRGITLAMVSGALTSGLGYVIWYAALEYLSAMQAALVQLSVPAIATAGGLFLLAESVSPQFVLSAMLVLGGISLAVARKSR